MLLVEEWSLNLKLIFIRLPENLKLNPSHHNTKNPTKYLTVSPNNNRNAIKNFVPNDQGQFKKEKLFLFPKV